MKTITILLTISVWVAVFISGCCKKVDPCFFTNADYSTSKGLWRIEDSLSNGFCLYLFSSEPTSYLWDLGDGTTTIDRYFKHLYANPGTYEVKLIVTGECNTAAKSETVTVVSATVQDYPGTYNANAGSALCLCDTNKYCPSQMAYDITINVIDTNSITIHNFDNRSWDVNAIVSGHNLFIPAQFIGLDSINGKGGLSADHVGISLEYSINGFQKRCWVPFTKQ